MKMKASKEEKPTGKGLVLLKKAKSDIQKVKKPKAVTLKQSAAVKAGTKLVKITKDDQLLKKVKVENVNHTNAGKKKKTEQENLPPLVVEKQRKKPVKQVKKLKKQKDATPGTMEVEKKEEEQEKKEEEITPEDAAKQAQLNDKKKLIALKKKQQKAGGMIAEGETENALALLPEQLVKEESFRKLYQVAHAKFTGKDNNLFGDDLKYALQIVSFKVPRCPSRFARVALPHPVLRKDDEICLIVRDLTRGRDVDYLHTRYHWEDKLSELSVGLKMEVIPFQQLKRDYSAFEMKRKLLHRFERFVVDARISGHVYAFLGAAFQRGAKKPIPVKLSGRDESIKANLEQVTLLQQYRQSNIGVVTSIKFAVHWMPEDEAVENGMALIEKLKTIHPGGWLNVQSINLTAECDKPYSLPLYVSKTNPNAVPVPVVTGPRQKFVKKQQKLFSKQSGGKFKVTKDGVVQRVRVEGEPESDVEISLEDLEPEDDDNYLPYDDEPPARMRSGGRPRQRGPKMRIK